MTLNPVAEIENATIPAATPARDLLMATVTIMPSSDKKKQKRRNSVRHHELDGGVLETFGEKEVSYTCPEVPGPKPVSGAHR